MTTTVSKAEDPMGVARIVLGKSLMRVQTYRVTWSIDVDAETAEDAARQASEIQLDRESIASVFDVVEPSGNHVTIDLQA